MPERFVVEPPSGDNRFEVTPPAEGVGDRFAVKEFEPILNPKKKDKPSGIKSFIKEKTMAGLNKQYQEARVAVGAGETALKFGASLITFLPFNAWSGMSGLYTLARTGSIDKSAESIEKANQWAHESFGLDPKTEYGQKFSSAVDKVFEFLPSKAGRFTQDVSSTAVDYVAGKGSTAGRITGAATGATVSTVVQFAEFVLLFRSLHTKSTKKQLIGKERAAYDNMRKVMRHPEVKNMFLTPEWKKFIAEYQKPEVRAQLKALPADAGPSVTPSGAPKPVTGKGQVLATPEQELTYRTKPEMLTLPPQRALPKTGTPSRVESAPGARPVSGRGQVLATPEQELQHRAIAEPRVETPKALQAGTGVSMTPTIGKAKPVTSTGQVLADMKQEFEFRTKAQQPTTDIKAAHQVAQANGVVFNGVNTHKGEQMYFFTDESGTGTTFVTKNPSAKAVEQKLRDVRWEFKIADVGKESVKVHNENGGSSISQTGENLFGQPGFAVSPFKGRERVIPTKDLSELDFSRYAKDNAEFLKKNPDAFIGTWEDGGQTYLDISIRVASQKEALRLANKHKQEAIFDLEKGETIAADGIPISNATRTEESRFVENNASGESAASIEAINRNKVLKFFAIDERTGKARPLIGVDAVDARPKPYEIKVQATGKGVEIIERGDKTTGKVDAKAPGLIKKLLGNERGAIDIDPAKIKAGLGRVKNKFMEFWAPFSTMPEGELYKFYRSKAQGDMGRAESIALKFSQKINKYDLETRKTFFQALDGNKEAYAMLPPEVQRSVRQVTNKSDMIGKALVKRGIITEETFQSKKGEYVPYLIGKYLEQKGLPSTQKMTGGYNKGRKENLTYEERLEMGLIEDAGVAVPYGMGKELFDIVKFDSFKKIAENPEWAWAPSIVEVGGKKMGIGHLAEEAKTYNEMAARFRDNPAVAARAKELQAALDKASAEMGAAPEGFTQLPAGPQYGPLSGAFVREMIADDIMPLYSSVAMQNKSQTIKTLWKIENEGMALWKMTKTALNLPTAMRNVYSNFAQINMSGVPAQRIPGKVVEALQGMKKGDLDYRTAKRYGLFRTNWAVSEINEVLGEFSRVEPGNWSSFMDATKNVAKYYGKIDDVSKLTLFKIARSEGKSVADSVLYAQKWGMDYSLAPRSVKELRRHAIPFLSYQYKVAPLIAETLVKRPWVIAKYVAIPYIVNELITPEMNDIDAEEWDRLKAKMPEYIRNNKSVMILPWKNEKNQWQWVNMEYFYPWGNWMGVFRDLREGEVRQAYSSLGIGSHPILDLHVVMRGGGKNAPPVDTFTGQPIYDKLDSPAEQWGKIAEYLYTKWAPQMITRKGPAGYLAQAITGEEDKWGRKETIAKAAARWFGINIGTLVPKQESASRKARIRALETEYNRMKKDRSVSREERLKARKRLIEMRKEIRRGTD